jgi:hypothetical protein
MMIASSIGAAFGRAPDLDVSAFRAPACGALGSAVPALRALVFSGPRAASDGLVLSCEGGSRSHSSIPVIIAPA